MTSLTFYPLGNADTCLVTLKNERRMLIDFADKRDRNDPHDLRCDLPKLLKDDLRKAGIDAYSVVAFTHLDDDHCKGASEFFEFDHADIYKGGDRKPIETLWVPAAALIEENLPETARVIRQEARYRLRQGYGIRVFSRPDLLVSTMGQEVIDRAIARGLIVDAGQLVPGFDLYSDGVEFFAHSPHATRTNDRGILDRNSDSLVFQARFQEGGLNTDVIFSADVTYEDLGEIVDITRYHGNDDRLHWNVFKLPHHCSWKSIGPEKGFSKTQPTEQTSWLFEDQGEDTGFIIGTSWARPVRGSLDDRDKQPPHRQAIAYYEEDVLTYPERLIITMEKPSEAKPQPFTLIIDHRGARPKPIGTIGAAAIVGSTAPRAG